MPADPTMALTGLWLVATHKLGSPAMVGEPYQHICGTTCTCHPNQPPMRRLECAACQGGVRP